jgi:uncharacterized membrane protein
MDNDDESMEQMTARWFWRLWTSIMVLCLMGLVLVATGLVS